MEREVHGICEPPMISFNDFSENNKWPESMRAKYWEDYLEPDIEKWKYLINDRLR